MLSLKSPSSSQTQNTSFVVVIPAYNEERFIGSVVLQALQYTSLVVVIDDGSQDSTAAIAKRGGAVVISHKLNEGKSAAINTALGWARLNQVQTLVFLDGDGQHRPSDILQVAKPILSGEADMVVGSRFLTTRSKIPTYRKVGQHLLTQATNLASSVQLSDSQSGFRAFSRRAIELLNFTGTGLSVESEMQFLVREHALQVVEVPIAVIYHEKAKRNPFNHGLEILSNVMKLISQHRPLFFFGLAGLFSLLIGITMGLVILEIYVRTHELAIGYSLISVLFLILGVISLFVGLILNSLRAFYLDLKKSIQASDKKSIYVVDK